MQNLQHAGRELRVAESEFRLAVSTARQEQARFRVLVESSVDGVIQCTGDGTLVYVSPAAERALGRSAASVVGTTFTTYLHADDVEDARQRLLELRRGAASLDGGEAAVPALRRIVRPDGSVRWIEMLSRSMLDEPDVATVISNIRDVTERRLEEADLAAAQRRSSALFDSGIIGIMLSNDSGKIQQANDAFLEMLGYTREDLEAGRLDWGALTAPEWAAVTEEIRADVAATGRANPREKECLRKDGRRVPVLVGLTRLGDDETAAFMVDLTQRKQDVATMAALEEQFRQAQKMEAIGRLAGGVAHDFNNVLSVILSYAALILDEVPIGTPIRDDIEEIVRAGHRAADLTRQLLLVSRRQVVETRILDLNELLRGMAKMLARLVGEDVQVVSQLAPDCGRIMANAGSIEQVVMNLVVNARDAMPKGGVVTIDTANVTLDEAYAREHLDVTPGAYVRLAVRDVGVGMDAETRARIFEPFFTTKERGKGTGLGLSTTFGIVQQAGGHIRLQSELGEGTCFEIFLPAVAAQVVVDGASSLQTCARGTETILVVEDEAQVRAVACGILTRQGYRVVEASNAGEAFLASASQDKVDLLLSDVVMPSMSGPELAKRLGVLRPTMKTLLVSGYTADELHRHGGEELAAAIITKPFTPESLARKVREVLDG